ncbi:hypothetical protein [Modicisalibacter luteus]|uniref:Uncharacterized protein n=1 Tax=Modicisalibacter luteus TaxID=453962 RepID=A0ABV7LVI1_9GAMM|nr:hypothetical protein [Halomonas lutea]GHB14159.1 hypothetical protein GCM10007159_40660 [Halomonas lutea]
MIYAALIPSEVAITMGGDDVRLRLDLLAGGTLKEIDAVRASTGISPQVRGGMVNGWKRHARAAALTLLTAYALSRSNSDTRPGRDNVRAWQLRVFGQSLARKQLQWWAEPERVGGGRGATVVVPTITEAWVAARIRAFCRRSARW